MALLSLMPGLVSPDIRNLIIPKGFSLIKADDDTQFRHMGNMPSVVFTPSVETIEHFDSMAGIKTKDETITLSQGGEVKLTAEEATARNLAMMIGGTINDTDLNAVTIDIFSRENIVAEYKFISTNKKGPRWYWHFRKLTFVPAGDINMVGDTYGNFVINGSVESVDGDFGTVTLKPPVDSVIPEFVLNPYLYGQNPTEEGDVLTVAKGGPVGHSSITYVWKKAGVAITGPAETSQSYVVRAGDNGTEITCTVTLTNAVGNVSVTTAGITIGTTL